MISNRFSLLLVIGCLLAASQPASAQDAASQVAAEEALIVGDAQTSFIQNAFIASPLAGVVANVSVKEGQMIESGTAMVFLDSELAERELVAAKATVDAAKVTSENDVNRRYAERTLQVREQEMAQSRLANQTYEGAVSSMEIEELRLQIDQARLAIEQAEHEMEIAEANTTEKLTELSIAQTKLDRHTIRTTVSGLVAEVDVQSGEWVDAGKPIVRIISLDPIRVECFVDGHKHGRELVGNRVSFLPSGAEQPVEGEVTFVSPELHPVTGQVRLWATVSNPDGKIGSGAKGKLTVLARGSD